MKKTLKILGLLLLILPSFGTVSCIKDEDVDEKAPFKDYSFLLNKTHDEILNKLMKDYYSGVDEGFVDEGYIGYSDYHDNLGLNISYVDCYFGPYYDLPNDDTCVEVDVEVKGLKPSDILEYLTKRYGKYVSYYYLDEDEEEYDFVKGNMLIEFCKMGSRLYIEYKNKEKWEKYYEEWLEHDPYYSRKHDRHNINQD